MPTRTCIGCRDSADQASLLRVTCLGSGRLDISMEKRHGRGAYLCPNIDCISRAFKRKAFDRAFKRRVVLPADPEELLAMAITAVRGCLESMDAHADTERSARTALVRVLRSLTGIREANEERNPTNRKN